MPAAVHSALDLIALQTSLNQLQACTCPNCTLAARYEELGKAVLGEWAGFWVVATTQFILLVGLMVTYMVTAGQSLQAAANPNCNDHTMQVCPFIHSCPLGAEQVFLGNPPPLFPRGGGGGAWVPLHTLKHAGLSVHCVDGLWPLARPQCSLPGAFRGAS